MTASLSQHHEYTFADYLPLERDSDVKHEFDAGEILAMSGGTARHRALAAKVGIALGTTHPHGCIVFQSDMRVRVAATGRATYPDVSMVGGPIDYDPEDAARTTITNPVLSPPGRRSISRCCTPIFRSEGDLTSPPPAVPARVPT